MALCYIVLWLHIINIAKTHILFKSLFWKTVLYSRWSYDHPILQYYILQYYMQFLSFWHNKNMISSEDRFWMFVKVSIKQSKHRWGTHLNELIKIWPLSAGFMSIWTYLSRHSNAKYPILSNFSNAILPFIRI